MMKKFISVVLTLIMIISAMTVSLAQDGNPDGFKINSPAANEAIYQGEALKLSCTAPNAASVTFKFGGVAVENVTKDGNNFTAEVATSNLETMGIVAVETEAFDEDGVQLAYDKRYVNVVKYIGGTSVGIDDNKQEYLSVDGTNICKVYVNAEKVNSGEYPWMVFQNASSTKSATIAICDSQYFTGRFRATFDIMTATEVDNIELCLHGSTTKYSSNNATDDRESYSAYTNLFGKDGKINGEAAYEEDTWYSVTVIIDLNEDTKFLKVSDADGVVYSKKQNIGKDYKSLGNMKLVLTSNASAQRASTEATGAHANGTTADSATWDEKVKNCGFAAMKVENCKFKSVSGLYEDTISYDDANMTTRIIPNTAETLTVRFDNPILNAEKAELWIDGVKQPSAIFSLTEAIDYTHPGTKSSYYHKLTAKLPESLSVGSKIEIKLLEGANWLHSLNTRSGSTNQKTATTTSDIIIPVTVGDENGFYATLKTEDASAVLTSANGGNAKTAKIILASYDSASKTELKAIRVITRALSGENLYRISNSATNGGTYTEAFVWDDGTLAPIKTVKQ